ncbi:chloride channel protein EriC [Sphaerochaeta pleomorpha str. Grapes]|uniref:Chloride channel protein EriC n=1 Tax=Sphaerochaeta pleomorpha (strain ATCC BAA-1885 / DSM 22778 / Grapes) TaxID=158190 RepID=G8QXG2_SPHPG|nr:chloride channel protein [Sphaerochaeta pleomorpha]AEV28463.1 chloride channel protein EriC [Sphaerochaeta pleomorpha str. Grapes]
MPKTVDNHGSSSYEQVRLTQDNQIKRTMFISLLCVFVGIIAGFGAVGFRYLIDFFYNLFFHGILSFEGKDATAAISRWGKYVILVPAFGIALANFITEKWAPEAKGHGVPEVMAAVALNQGKIRPVVALVKTFASAITIGSGGSVGREGPIVQIGSSFGSTLGQMFKLSSRETIILVGAGAAGGISATFNAPIGGVMFALELILPEYSIMTIMPLVVSSTVATYLAAIFLGTSPAFIIPQYSMVSPYELIFHIFLGLLAGLLSVGFIKAVYRVEDAIDKIKVPSLVKSLVGGTLIGVIGYLSLTFFGAYYIFGVGYEFMDFVLANQATSFFMLLLLIGLKVLANTLTLGSGGSGGIFAPSLFLGAALGGAVGIVVNAAFPGSTGSVAAYAMVGMAAVVSGVTGGVLTSIIMLFEMTRNYEIMLPVMLAAVIAHFIAKLLYSDTMYTKKLTRRGVQIQLDKRISTFKGLSVADILKKGIVSCQPSDTVKDTLSVMYTHELGVLPVIDAEQNVLGTISYKELYKAKAADTDTIGPYVFRHPITIPSKSNLSDALEVMEKGKSDILVVQDGNKNLGIITIKRIVRFTMEKSRLS